MSRPGRGRLALTGRRPQRSVLLLATAAWLALAVVGVAVTLRGGKAATPGHEQPRPASRRVPGARRRAGPRPRRRPGRRDLYASAHFGLFAQPATSPAHRIANRNQDTMGFTVTGPGTFLGSGHADFREDDVHPPLLG